jgi:hypothetical protein
MKIILTESQVKRLNHTIIEQIDTDDEERELMNTWYGDDENEDVELDYNYAPEYDMDSEDSYELSRDKDTTNRMRRSVRVGGAGAVDKETQPYRIDGKVYMLTPIEYRQMLRDRDRITPEKAANMGVKVDSSGVMRKSSDEVRTKIKALEKRMRTIQNDIDRFEPVVNSGNADERLKWKLKYLKASLDTYMEEYDELTGNVDGEEYNF